MINIAFLASHTGSNMQVIIDACKNNELNMNPVIIISNNSKSVALKRAKIEKIPYYCLNSKQFPNPVDLDEIILEKLLYHKAQLIILAGYMKKIGKKTLLNYKDRILNIHPALLPKYGGKGMYGLNVHKTVLENKEKETGISIHIVDEKYDHGKIISQIKIPIPKSVTPEQLQQKVLKYEHTFFVETLKKISLKNNKLTITIK